MAELLIKLKKKQVSGKGRISFYLKNFAPGIYFYQIIKYNNKVEKSKVFKLIITK